MSRPWTLTAARATALCLLCLLVAMVPGSAIIAPPSPQSHTMVAADLEDSVRDKEDVDASPGPPPGRIVGELSTKSAPPPAGPDTDVPILLYHYIRVNPNLRDRVGFSLSTTPALFRQQMQYLADQGFHVISLHQAVDAIRHHTGLPSRPVVLTFDDGYADFFATAVPILLSHGFTATDFVITGRMGWPGFLTPNQVVAADGMGFTIGAHTVDHVALAGCTPARASWEMRQSKLSLETLLGHPVPDFAYPYGSFNAYDMGQANALGFETAVSTISGTVHSAGQLFDLSRRRIGGNMPLTYFAHLVGGPPPTRAELRNL